MSVLPNEMRKKLSDKGLQENYLEILVQDKSRAGYFLKASELAEEHEIEVKTVADAMVNTKLDEEYQEPAGLVKKLLEVTKKDFANETETVNAVKAVLEKEEKAVADYKAGKKEVIGYLIGMVQKDLKGKGEVETVRTQLEKQLDDR